MLSRIRIRNFKSFRDAEIELGRFNVLIGANASGKSNFVQVLKFFRDIEGFGLKNAISLQGGIEYLRNINIGGSAHLSLGMEANPAEITAVSLRTAREDEHVYMFPRSAKYELEIEFSKRGDEYSIALDRLTASGEFAGYTKGDQGDESKTEYGEGKIVVSIDSGKPTVAASAPTGLSLDLNGMGFEFLRDGRISSGRATSNELTLARSPSVHGPFGDIAIFDFDPKLPKKATPVTGKAELEEDGSNLAIVLKGIIENKEQKRKLSNLLRDVLPFVKALNVEKFADKSLLFGLRETYSSSNSLPASFISDGTIHVIALILALYFENKPITIIEEPERNIHPHLVGKVVAMMNEATRDKQILVTTHNVEMVRGAGLDNLFLFARDAEGFSVISRPSEKEEVKTFLENQMGIEELYVDDLLKV